MNLPKTGLSNVQIELLKLFGTDLLEEDMRELREQLGQFYARKSVGKLNEVQKERNLVQKNVPWLRTNSTRRLNRNNRLY